MKIKVFLVLSFSFLFLFPSCSLVRNVAVDTTSDLFKEASLEMESEPNWISFEQGTIANIKMLEGLHFVRPFNQKLLMALTKAYAGYAFGVWETRFIGDSFTVSKKPSFYKQQALLFYEKASYYGIKFLKERDLDYTKDLLPLMGQEKKLYKLLHKNINSADHSQLETLLYFSQAMASRMNLEKDNFTLINELPLVVSLMTWVCEKSPDIQHGACDLFFGSYHAARPTTLGGNPAKGLEHFDKAIAKYSYNILASVLKIQFYYIPLQLEGEIEMALREIEKKCKDWQALSWKTKQTRPANLLNGIACKRIEILEQQKKNFFE